MVHRRAVCERLLPWRCSALPKHPLGSHVSDSRLRAARSQDAPVGAGVPGDDPQSTQDLTIFVRTFFAACIQSAALARLLVDACARRSRCKICCSKCRAASLQCPTPSSAEVSPLRVPRAPVGYDASLSRRASPAKHLRACSVARGSRSRRHGDNLIFFCFHRCAAHATRA